MWWISFILGIFVGTSFAFVMLVFLTSNRTNEKELINEEGKENHED